MEESLESMSVVQLAIWLESKGIPEEFCKKFEENYIDGSEFVGLNLPEVREMVPPIGLAKKIMKLIPKADPAPLQQLSPPPEVTPSTSHQLSATSRRSSLSPGPHSPLSPFSRREGSISSISTTPSRTERIQIPDFWREDTQTCIDEGVLNNESRSDIVRTLVTLLVAKHGPRPGRVHCEELARQLILKYPFMKDDIGNGYASWVAKMKECLDNRIKQSRKKMRKQTGDASPNPKRQRFGTHKDELLHRYPVRVEELTSDDAHSIAEHKKALYEEMRKAKPRDPVVLPLMRNTFTERRMYIQNEASTVKEILEKYPALVRPAVVEQEMALIVGKKDIRTAFERAWTMSYVPALLHYGERSKKKIIKDIISKLNESDDASRQKTALEILVVGMKCSTSEKSDPLCYLYEEYEITDTPEHVCTESPSRSSPRIAVFLGDETIQYYVLVELCVLCQVPSFQYALFLVFSAYYLFHLEYPKPIKNVMYFFQDYVLSYPDSQRRPANYLATASDIKKLTSLH